MSIAPPAAARSAARTLRILHVEDDEAVVEAVRAILNLDGRVEVVNLRNTLDVAEYQADVDLAVLDVWFAERNRLDFLLMTIRDPDHWPHCGVVLLTGSPVSRSARVDDVVDKGDFEQSPIRLRNVVLDVLEMTVATGRIGRFDVAALREAYAPCPPPAPPAPDVEVSRFEVRGVVENLDFDADNVEVLLEETYPDRPAAFKTYYIRKFLFNGSEPPQRGRSFVLVTTKSASGAIRHEILPGRLTDEERAAIDKIKANDQLVELRRKQEKLIRERLGKPERP